MNELINNFDMCNLNENYEDFINGIENKYQANILLKLYLKSDIVLCNYRNENDILNIEILGAKNKISTLREKYNIIINNNKCYCNCKDFIFRSKKHDIVCKHICFLICKVSNIFDVLFFKDKIMSNENVKRILNVLNNINEEFNPKNVDIKENCQICCESFGKNTLVCCPKCKNCVHKKCMNMWIQKTDKINCIYCRDSWENYKM